jgi:hypothetical protein
MQRHRTVTNDCTALLLVSTEDIRPGESAELRAEVESPEDDFALESVANAAA